MSIPRSRILDLMKVQCRIFNTAFNPERLRTGNKILRQRLKGPALATYYPTKTATIADIRKLYARHGEIKVVDEDEEQRLADIARRKARGKGAPKKKRTAAESRKNKKKK